MASDEEIDKVVDDAVARGDAAADEEREKVKTWHQNIRIEAIARVCHAANQPVKALCGEEPAKPWDEASEMMKNSVRDGVRKAIEGVPPEESHENWIRYKEAEGWVHGDTIDEDAKTHPCLVPYAELPPEQRLKDQVFTAIVQAMK